MHTPQETPAPAPDPPRARPVQADRGGVVTEPQEPPRARPATPHHPLTIHQKRWHTGIDLIAVFGLFGLCVVLMAVAGARLTGEQAPGVSPEEGPRGSPFRPEEALFTGGAAVLIVLGTVRLRRQPWTSIGVRSSNVAADLGLGAAACVLFSLCMVAATTALWLTDPALFEVVQESGDRLQALLPPMGPVTILLLSAWVGLYEELLFRGFLLPRLRLLLGSWTAAVLAGSVFFALLHGYQGPIALVAIFFLSLLLSVLFVWRRSLLPVVAGHFLFDLLQMTLLQMRSRLLSPGPPAPAWAWWS